MKTTWTVKEKSTGVLEVTINDDAWKTAQTKAVDKLVKSVNLPGFRKGQAPKELARKQISEQQILAEAVDQIANDALFAGIKEHNLLPITRPELNVSKITVDEVVMTFDLIIKPDVKLGEYKGLDVKKAEVSVLPEDVDAKIEELRVQFTELVLKETGKVEAKDTAVIDFEGFREGVAFEGGKGENFELEIGSGSFIPGFEDALIGMEAGEEKDVPLTFPETYGQAELAGQPVVFKVKINEIKQRTLPELNDDFAKEANHHGTETIADLRAHLEEDLLEEKTQNADVEFGNQLLTKVVEASEVDIPDVLIEEETDSLVADFKNRISQQGYTMELFTQITGQNEAELRTQMKADATNKVKVRLVLDAVATAEKLDVTSEEIVQEYDAIAKAYSMELARVKELAPADTIAYDLRLRKAFNLIRESVQQ
ncbi:MAG: trigger factor [Erysipelotrichaceae bacterium]